MKLASTETCVLPYPPERVFAALMDLPNYGKWFPTNLKFELEKHVEGGVGSVYRLSSQPVSWRINVVEVEQNKRITMHYDDGPWEGTAIWALSSTDGKHTQLDYTLDLKIVGMMMQMMAKMVDPVDLNRQQMHKVFVGLDTYLKDAAV